MLSPYAGMALGIGSLSGREKPFFKTADLLLAGSSSIL